MSQSLGMLYYPVKDHESGAIVQRATPPARIFDFVQIDEATTKILFMNGTSVVAYQPFGPLTLAYESITNVPDMLKGNRS